MEFTCSFPPGPSSVEWDATSGVARLRPGVPPRLARPVLGRVGDAGDGRDADRAHRPRCPRDPQPASRPHDRVGGRDDRAPRARPAGRGGRHRVHRSGHARVSARCLGRRRRVRPQPPGAAARRDGRGRRAEDRHASTPTVGRRSGPSRSRSSSPPTGRRGSRSARTTGDGVFCMSPVSGFTRASSGPPAPSCGPGRRSPRRACSTRWARRSH